MVKRAMILPLASAIELLLRPGARHANDESALRSLRLAELGADLPRGLSLTWLGTAGFAVEHEGYVLVIDPYVSRPGVERVFNRRPLRPDLARIERCVPKADAILVGHTHFDHALDVPAMARLRGAKVYGSRSLARLMGLYGLEGQAVVVEPARVYALGPFEVTFIESVHSKLLLGLSVPMGGELTCDHLDDLHGGAYRCGQVYGIHVRVAGRSFYHQGSANLLEDRVRHHDVDYFLAGISGRGFTVDYTARVLRALSPRFVIPHHFDDFFRPVDAKLGFSLNVNLGGFVEEVARVSKDIAVRTLEPLQTARG